MTLRLCKVCGGWHSLDQDWPSECFPKRADKRGAMPVPHFITDTMDGVQHPCDGKIYDSKAAFRAVTKANGCVELGNDAPTAKAPIKRPDRKAIRETVAKAMNRVGL